MVRNPVQLSVIKPATHERMAALHPSGSDKCSEAEYIGLKILEGYTTCVFDLQVSGTTRLSIGSGRSDGVSTVPALIPIAISLNKAEAEEGITINLFGVLARTRDEF